MARRDSRTIKDQVAVARDKGKLKQALKGYLELEQIEPEDGEWARRAADMYRRLGNDNMAVAALERAVDKYVRAGFLVKAIAACKMILQIDPSHSEIQQRLTALDVERTGVGGPVGIASPEKPIEPVPIRRRSGRRTLPPGAPLDQVNLGEVVPGARQEVDARGEDSGVFEIPIDEDSGVIVIDDMDLVDIELEDDDEEETRDHGGAPAAVAAPAAAPLSEGARRALHETPLLSSLGPDAMQRLVAEVELVQLEPGQVLFRQGDAGDALYVVAEGSVSVIAEGPPRVELSNLGEGQFFGELALVTDQVRNATIEAHPQTGASLLAIAREVISDVIDEEPAVLQALLRFLRDRLVDNLVASSPLFAPFAGDERRELAGRFRFLEVKPGALMMEQGARAHGFYILLAGELEALYREAAGARGVGHLRPGDVFGEMSLLSHAPAEITVRAVTKSFLLELPANTFREVIMTHPQVLMMVSDLADSRRHALEQVLSGQGEYPTGGMRLV
ncbi:cyclic nucleotide-binding domain-containing protein [Haliangium ochraceum]|uniref:Putative transcriptional regulator, Crp/Fnr family n=1 Tax=Haliangium ochraceum (strain DSM 14365 / JCM 11303 / SMP-2) TaxID=502025 RepID=D0LV29_HALO1|nr:cyclic nucleotide-binding domain-containing protein [Haliangium ochraceum]ACY15870.1 putative transcriptional regulator, Crp/Fnr family [Haliangium ochraceum DSM 14365]